jgi:hypothetical protein
MALMTTIGLIAGLNALLGIGIGLSTVKLQETAPLSAPLPALLIIPLTIYGQVHFGDQLDPSVATLEVWVLAAVGGGLIGLLVVFLAVQPEN